MRRSYSGVKSGNCIVSCYDMLVHVSCSIPMSLESCGNCLLTFFCVFLASVCFSFNEHFMIKKNILFARMF